MPATEQHCYTFIQLPGTFEWVVCGVLRVSEFSPNTYQGIFHYGRSYLARPNAVSLDPYHLPLSDRAMEFTTLKGIPGALRDAGPDAWGRRVIQAKLGRTEAACSEIDYLIHGPDDAAGNLRFALTPATPTPSRPFNRTHQLPALIDATQQLAHSGKLTHEILASLEPGTSMGGARPKVSIEDNQTLWLAKLPEQNATMNLQRVEYATLELARYAGLNVCNTRLESLGSGDALLVERFDRQRIDQANTYARFGLVSGLTVLDADDNYLGRERWSYLRLADELQRWSAKPDTDRLELFRRMVFNAMVTNNDDHPRNHALINTHGHWRLSPAYDIVPVPALSLERRDLALQVGTYGRTASVYNLLSQPAAFGLTVTDARSEIERLQAAVSAWRDVFKRHGVSQADIKTLAPAMLADSFHRTEPPQPIF